MRKCCGFASGKFKSSAQHYHSSFKKIVAIKNGIKHFSFYLISHNFLIEMDMCSFPKMLQYKQKIVPNPQLLRWANWFSQYTFEVKHIKGKSNIVANFFSRPPPKPTGFLMFTPEPLHYPPDLIAIPIPWQKEDLERNQINHEIEGVKCYGGSILNSLGVIPNIFLDEFSLLKMEIFPSLFCGFSGIYVYNFPFSWNYSVLSTHKPNLYIQTSKISCNGSSLFPSGLTYSHKI